ncbi:341e633b-d96f-4607-9a1f-ed4b42ab7e41 [Sclerotinia trifoliorum]|uniref:341e633b-d96f-4607-9a1f-ed4b42ab7e41 n=1 Tax=Sclerotinia trifoliorum TaxID=28548 RepID=A0A8H2VW28_9HELO|nr:341e633b-d96f-4607-9a1f-ed4b42ab7e41 [Sclerotinia trifoliorum]
MSKQYSGPIPSKLTLLANLLQFSQGDKVRFLGCVTSYDKTSAVLTLEHNFPVDNGFKAFVNIQLLLNSVQSHETKIGEWVNVVGYVVDIGESQDSKVCLSGSGIAIQAIVLWSSGPIQLDAYERSLMPCH